jgi:hypothetical protein
MRTQIKERSNYMKLGNTIKIITFFIITLATINNIATYNINTNYQPRLLLAIEPYDKIIANDIKTIMEVGVQNKKNSTLASSLYQIDKNINVLNIEKDYIKIKRKYIYQQEINSHLIECIFTLNTKIVKIDSCKYNKKIINKLNELIKQHINQQNQPFINIIDERNISKELTRSIYEKILSYQYYEIYFKKYFEDTKITDPYKKREKQLKLLNESDIISERGSITVKDENKDFNKLTNSKVYEYDFMIYLCKTKIENNLLYLEINLREKAPRSGPPITVTTECVDKK